MTLDEASALAEVLCLDCAGITRLPGIPVRMALRWCLCDLQEAIVEATREPIGFTKRAKKKAKRA